MPTGGWCPKDSLHDLALLRGAVYKQLRKAWLLGRAEKLLTFLDRLVLHSPRASGGGKRQGLGKLVSARLRLAWAGDWGALWREAVGAGAVAPHTGVRSETLA